MIRRTSFEVRRFCGGGRGCGEIIYSVKIAPEMPVLVKFSHLDNQFLHMDNFAFKKGAKIVILKRKSHLSSNFWRIDGKFQVISE